MQNEQYANIREILGALVGRTVIDVTQHDREEFQSGGFAYVMLMFDDGSYLKFPIGDEGFEHNCETVCVE